MLEQEQTAEFEWTPRLPAVELKGKGVVQTFWITARETSPTLRVQRHVVAKKLLDALGINVFPRCYYSGCPPGELCGCVDPGEQATGVSVIPVDGGNDDDDDDDGDRLVLHRAKHLALGRILTVAPAPAPAPSASTLAQMCSIDFNVLQVRADEDIFHAVMAIFQASVDLQALSVDLPVLQLLVWNVCRQYKMVSYHCLYHAFCVVQCLAYFLQQETVRENFTPNQTFTLLLAALIHDVGHPGTTNAQELAAQSYITKVFDGQSPLEQLHLDITFSLLHDERLNVFRHWAHEDVSEARSLITRTVLDTDMSQHGNLLQQLRNADDLGSSNKRGTFAHTMLLGSFLLHAADLSNACRPAAVAWHNSRLLMDEAALSATALTRGGGGIEVLAGSEPMAPMTRAAAQGEAGFFKGLVRPYFSALVLLFPTLQRLVDGIDDNIRELAAFVDAEPAEKGKMEV